MALIYVVEDDVNIQEIEMFALKNSGYRVEGFGNAKDFFAKLSEKTPDLILLDVMLPDLDGLSIFKKGADRSGYEKNTCDLCIGKDVGN